MVVIDAPISKTELKAMAADMFGNLVKAVVDVDRRLMALDGELYADEEALLLENGSQQDDLWGINLYPEIEGLDWIEFDSVINIRPSQNNRTRGVDDAAIRDHIIEIVSSLVK